jgi:hypothetical protein
LAGILILDLVVVRPVLDSEDVVLLWWEGKLSILLWIIGDGPRSPDISGVPSLLGLDGRLAVGIEAGD